MADLKHTCPVNCAVTGEPIATPCLACDAERGVCLLPKWIPCSERMPVQGQFVVAGAADTLMVAIYRSGVFHDQFDGEVFASHWMPLPEPPK